MYIYIYTLTDYRYRHRETDRERETEEEEEEEGEKKRKEREGEEENRSQETEGEILKSRNKMLLKPERYQPIQNCHLATSSQSRAHWTSTERKCNRALTIQQKLL